LSLTKAEEEQRLFYKVPPQAPISIKKIESDLDSQKEFCLSQDEKSALKVGWQIIMTGKKEDQKLIRLLRTWQ